MSLRYCQDMRTSGITASLVHEAYRLAFFHLVFTSTYFTIFLRLVFSHPFLVILHSLPRLPSSFCLFSFLFLSSSFLSQPSYVPFSPPSRPFLPVARDPRPAGGLVTRSLLLVLAQLHRQRGIFQLHRTRLRHLLRLLNPRLPLLPRLTFWRGQRAHQRSSASHLVPMGRVLPLARSHRCGLRAIQSSCSSCLCWATVNARCSSIRFCFSSASGS